MLNLPEPGKATGILARAWGGQIDENRRREEEKTKMIGNALLQQAQSGTLDEKGFAALDLIDPALGSTARNMNKQASEQNTMKLANMRQEKLLTSLKMRSEDLNMLEKLEKLGDTETAKMIIEKWNEFSKIAGTNAPISPLMDAVTRREQIEKTTTAILNKSITQVEKEPTIDALIQAKKDLIASTKHMNKDIAALYGKRIDAAEDRLKKKTEREESLKTKEAEEDREVQIQKDKESRAATAPTDDIKEYNFAKTQGETGTFTEWMKANKKESGTLTEGAVSKSFFDYAWQVGDNTLGQKMYKRYLELKKGMPREEAYSKTYDEMSVKDNAPGGDIRPVPGQAPKAPPPPLSEKDIKYNMTKYKKTRKEVMDAYKSKYGIK